MTCTIQWNGDPAHPRAEGVNIKGLRIRKGQHDVPDTVAYALRANYPGQVKVLSGTPVEPGGAGDPAQRIKAIKADMAANPRAMLAGVAEVPRDLRVALDKVKADEDPRAVVPVPHRAGAALYCVLVGRRALAEQLLLQG